MEVKVYSNTREIEERYLCGIAHRPTHTQLYVGANQKITQSRSAISHALWNLSAALLYNCVKPDLTPHIGEFCKR